MKALKWIHGLSAGLVMLLRVTAVGIYLVTSGDYPVRQGVAQKILDLVRG